MNNSNNNYRRGQPAPPGTLPRHGSSGNITVPTNRTDGGTRGVPRASSSGSLAMPQQLRTSQAVVPMRTKTPPKLSNPNPDPWGDDDDDEIWGGAEMDHILSQLEEPQPRVTPEEDKDLNRPTAAESFLLRRQLLEGRSQESGTLCSPSLVEESPEELQRKLLLAEEEKLKLKENETRLKGEAATLRIVIKNLQKESQNLVTKKLESTREANELKEKLEEKHRQEIAKLQAEVRELNMELTKGKMSRSFSSSQSPKSVPGSGPSMSSVDAICSTPVNLHDTSAVGSTSIPIRTKEKESSSATTQATPNSGSHPSMNTSSASISLGAEDEEMKINWPKLSSTRATLDIEDDDEDHPSSRVRDKVFRSIERMVDLRFQLNLPLLESIVKRAPKEIMRRLVSQPEEIKSVFPDMVDYMYLWGIEKERKTVRAAMGLPEPPRVPPLPRSDAGGWEDFFRTVLAIEIRMREDGIWGGLMEVKDALEELLRSVAGTEGRVKMYERPTLGRLWKLLAWAEELWRCVVIEEDSDPELVKRHKQKWADELEGWTGLVLKTDWRDYFFLELEVEVRKFSLSILASIAAAGYFEQKRKRYVILGRILTDVLTKEAFAKDMRNIRHVLKILTFTVSDLTILRSLCHRNNEGKCLAKLLGDCVAQILKSEVDDATKSLIYFDFLLFLNTLIRDKPLRLIQSNIAIENRNKTNDEAGCTNAVGMATSASSNASYGSSDPSLVSSWDCSMDVDVDSFAMSQFACPIRYSSGSENNNKEARGAETSSKTSANVQLTTDEKNLEEEVKFWLDPVLYEDPYGSGNRCQCRRHLVACGVIGLKVTFDLWLKAELDHERYLERLDAEEFAEIRQLREIFELNGSKRERAVCVYENIEDDGDANKKALVVAKAMKRLEARYADLEAKRAEMKSLEQEVTKIFMIRGRGAPIIEWNWNNVVQRQTEICGLLGIKSLPAWTLEMRRPPGILEECLSKAAFFISFIESRSENIAAAMGSDAYKVFMALIPLLRHYLDQFDISRVDKMLLLSVTNECDEDSFSSPLVMQTSQLYAKVTEQERNDFRDQTYSDIYSFAEVLPNLKPLTAETIQKITEKADVQVAQLASLPIPSVAEDEALDAALDAYLLENF